MAPTDDDFYNDTIKKYGPIAHSVLATSASIEKWRSDFPELLLKWWAEEGWGSLSNGQYWLCDPDQLRPVMEEVFEGDPEYTPDDLIPFGYNALGMIDVFMGQGRTMTINLPFGSIRWRDQSLNTRGERNSEFQVLIRRIRSGAHRLDWNDENGIQIFPWVLKNLGPLAPGEIYGFVPAYSMTQRYPVENLQKQPLVEHLVFLASLQKPTLYDYEKPEGGQGGFGTLVPRRTVGSQP